jgi:hypothetical protein
MYIVVLLFINNTEEMGLLLLMVWFMAAHTFILGDMYEKWDAFDYSSHGTFHQIVYFYWRSIAVTCMFLLFSLVFLSVYLVKVIAAKDTNIGISAINPDNESIVYNYKFFFVITEFILLIVILYLFGIFTNRVQQYDSEPTSLATLFTGFLSCFFILFVILFSVLSAVYITNGSAAFSIAFTVVVSLNFLLLVPVLRANNIDIVKSWQPIFMYLLIIKIICAAFYCMFLAIQLYNTNKLII